MDAPSIIARAQSWIQIAAYAPSGDNSQPWQVGLGMPGSRLVLTLDLDESTRTTPSLFDTNFVASLISLGAFAENFRLLAEAEGYELVDLRETLARFTLNFVPSNSSAKFSPREIAALIRQRVTNRFPFENEPLDPNTFAAITALTAESPNHLCIRAFCAKEKRQLADMFYSLDQVRYQNTGFYLEFLDKLRFGKEAEESRDGLRDVTLGAPRPALIFLRILRRLRRSPAARLLFFIGLQKLMAFIGCRMLVRKSAAVIVISARADTPEEWFALGRCFQRVWLELTQHRVAVQPLGTTFLVYRFIYERDRSEISSFTKHEQGLLLCAYKRFDEQFGIDLRLPCIAFRIGHARETIGRSLRRSVAIHPL